MKLTRCCIELHLHLNANASFILAVTKFCIGGGGGGGKYGTPYNDLYGVTLLGFSYMNGWDFNPGCKKVQKADKVNRCISCL